MHIKIHYTYINIDTQIHTILLLNHPQYTAFKSTVYISDYAIICINKSNAKYLTVVSHLKMLL